MQDTGSTAERMLLIQGLADEFAASRDVRQRRRHLDPLDFARLRDTGLPLLAIPESSGGLWVDTRQSTRPICEALRVLARGDASVALVASMHPSVLSFWLASPEAPRELRSPWHAQREAVYGTVREGAWWGTLTSEPGSGGDVAATRTLAEPEPSTGLYRLTGAKHFGSGSGITSYVLTSALPRGEAEPDWFFLDVRGVPWDGTAGVTLVSEWDGAGMIATQSHAFRFERFPATRFAWDRNLLGLQAAAGGSIMCFFASVIVGVAQEAMETARRQLGRRNDELRPYEQVEWARAEIESWLIEQAYEGMLRAVEVGAGSPPQVRCGKIALSELAESLLGRLCRVLGGGTYSRHSPFSYWLEDVRALGFLRPPWGLGFDALYQAIRPTRT
jgi:alkylation response protein AidB-like acyl-CoA dehydrogenase